jgi:hypothetical protein
MGLTDFTIPTEMIGTTSTYLKWFEDSHCPKCGSNDGMYFDENNNECKQCHWKGEVSDLLDDEEYINKTRSEKLKEILK